MGIRDGFDPAAYALAKEHAKELARSDREMVRQLVAVRKQQGLTQGDVAERIGCDQAAVSRFESMVHDPHLSTVRAYAHAVGADIRHAVSIREGRVVEGQVHGGGVSVGDPSVVGSGGQGW